MSEDVAGCTRCAPEDADAAWAALQTLMSDSELIEESHYHVHIRICPECSQRFLIVFTETIDWIDGEDPMYWSVLPITADERERLNARGAEVLESELVSLAPDRRCLRHDYPKETPASSYWDKGIIVRRHD